MIKPSSQLMQMIAEMQGQSDDDDDTLTDEQQATRLTELFEKRKVVYEFEPGDLIQHKYPNAAVYTVAGKVGLFMDYLDKPVDYSQQKHDPTSLDAAKIYDCRVGYIRKGHLVVYLMDSREFQPMEVTKQ